MWYAGGRVRMSSRLARSAGLIGVATMASRCSGVAREMVLAALFGAGNGVEMDAFNVAFRVPNLLRDLFAEGAMTAAFVPTFTRTLTTRRPRGSVAARQPRHQRAAARHGRLRRPRHRLRASDHARDRARGSRRSPGKLELTTQLTRMMLPFLTTVARAVAMMGMLNSLRRFFIPALSPAMFNVATIACAFALVPVMPRVGLPPIAGIAIGTLLGGARADRAAVAGAAAEGFRYRPIARLQGSRRCAKCCG